MNGGFEKAAEQAVEQIPLGDVRSAMLSFHDLQERARTSGKDLDAVADYQEALGARNAIRDSKGDMEVAQTEGRKLIDWLKKFEK